jgi:toxin-antitoxin system PIN domain toxin
MWQNSMMDLPDVGVWLALSIESHPHHHRARRYWDDEAANQIAFCRVTASGFLRLTTNGVVMGGFPLSVPQAWNAYVALRVLPEVVFLPEPEEVDMLLEELALASRFPARMWTDAYLAVFARAANLRLVSLDADFRRFEKLDFLHLRNS